MNEIHIKSIGYERDVQFEHDSNANYFKYIYLIELV